jgi:hypothetical protein
MLLRILLNYNQQNRISFAAISEMPNAKYVLTIPAIRSEGLQLPSCTRLLNAQAQLRAANLCSSVSGKIVLIQRANKDARMIENFNFLESMFENIFGRDFVSYYELEAVSFDKALRPDVALCAFANATVVLHVHGAAGAFAMLSTQASIIEIVGMQC